MRSVHVDQVEWLHLKGRSVKVMTEALLVKNLTIGIVELPERRIKHGDIKGLDPIYVV